MNTKTVLSIVLLVVGLLVLIILTVMGGVVKKTVDDGIYSRLEYELPAGYKDNKDYQECYRATHAAFDEEYYLWNLTNLPAVLAGAKPEYNLTGPFAYTQYYCDYDHKIDKKSGILTYRSTYEGYFFIRHNSSDDDTALITNVNPGYLGVLKQAGYSSDNLIFAMTPSALKTIITTFQQPQTLVLVWRNAIPTVLPLVNQQVSAGLTAGLIATINTINLVTYFLDRNPAFNGIMTWPNWADENNAVVDYTISTPTKTAIQAVWANSTTSFPFGGAPPTYGYPAEYLAVQYGIQLDQARSLKRYASEYLLNHPLMRTQWANASALPQRGTVYPGYEVGWPTSTDIVDADVQKLFSASNPCALTNNTGIQLWFLANSADMASSLLYQRCSAAFNLTVPQYTAIRNWLDSFTTGPVSSILKTQWQLTEWNDFAYAQWGSLVAGQSLGPAGGLPYMPEIRAYNATVDGGNSTCVQYSASQAKALLNGTMDLFNTTHLQTFYGLFQQQNWAQINNIWGIDSDKAICFSNYIRKIIQGQAISLQLQDAFARGGGLFTTRTVREWLFDAEDPLLVLLEQPNPNVALVGNLTRNMTEANERNATNLRIYTGDNDLYWSLMPTRNNEPLPFWNGDVRITGYNGSQFLPNGYVDNLSSSKYDDKPLELWNAKINRSIPFKNAGSDSWDGVHVRYLTLADDALASEVENPYNARFYATYSGVVNKTSNPPYLPVFLTTPNFRSAEQAFKENATLTDLIFDDYDPNEKKSRHRLALFLLVEPTLGSTLWGNLPIQVNLQYRPDGFFPNVMPGFAPVYWNAIGDIATPKDLQNVKDQLYFGQRAWKILIGVGVGVGATIVIVSSVLVHHFRKHENELQEIPMNSSTG